MLLLSSVGSALGSQGRHAEARDAFSRVIELDPVCPDAYTRRAKAHVHLGDTQAAQRDKEQARRLFLSADNTENPLRFKHYRLVIVAVEIAALALLLCAISSCSERKRR